MVNDETIRRLEKSIKEFCDIKITKLKNLNYKLELNGTRIWVNKNETDWNSEKLFGFLRGMLEYYFINLKTNKDFKTIKNSVS